MFGYTKPCRRFACMEALSAEEVFAALVASGEKLERVIRMNEGSANADLRKFTAEIQALCEKWDRN